MSSVFRQPYPKSNMRGRMLLDLNSPLGQAGRWLGYSGSLRTQDFLPWKCTWVQMVMVWPRWKDSQKDQGPVWKSCLAISSISVDSSTLLTGTDFLQAVHVPKEKKKNNDFQLSSHSESSTRCKPKSLEGLPGKFLKCANQGACRLCPSPSLNFLPLNLVVTLKTVFVTAPFPTNNTRHSCHLITTIQRVNKYTGEHCSL